MPYVFFMVGFLVHWYINLYGLFNTKAIFVKELHWYYLTSPIGEMCQGYFISVYYKCPIIVETFETSGIKFLKIFFK